MAVKDFKSIDEQIEILRNRGLEIPNTQCAKDFITRHNYYRVSGYSLTLRKNDRFLQNVTFQNITDIYMFDCGLRHILLRFLESVETTVKSVYAYEFAKRYGPLGYLDGVHFADSERAREEVEKGRQMVERQHKHEAFLQHYLDELHQELPIWVFVEVLTFSGISRLYSASEQELQKAVAAHFGLNMNTGGTILAKMLHSMVLLRNLCAHGGRLFNRLFHQKPSLNKQEKKLLRVDEDGLKDNARLYGFILVMRRLMQEDEFKEMITAVAALNARYPFVAMKHYGFRNDWYRVLT